MSELLGDVAEIVRGVTYEGGDAAASPRAGYLPILRAGNIADQLILDTDLVWVPESRVTLEQRMQPGDIAICMSSGSPLVVGKTAMLDHPFECSVGAFCALIRPRRVDAQFLALWLRSPAFWQWRDAQARGGSIQNLRLTQLAALEVPVPAPADQLRIAAETRHQLAVVESMRRASMDRVADAQHLRTTVVRDAIPLPVADSWPWVPLSEAAEFLDAQRRPVNVAERRRRTHGKQETDLYPYFGANGQTGWIDGYLFDEPLVLLAEDGGAFGSHHRPIAFRVDGKVWVNNHAHVLRPRNGVDVDFLCYALSLRPDIGSLVSGSTRGKLNQQIAAAILVPLPASGEQRGVAAGLTQRLASVDSLIQAVEAERETIESLPAQILRQAFPLSGERVEA